MDDVSYLLNRLCTRLKLDGGVDAALVEVKVTPAAFDLLTSQPLMDRRWSDERGGAVIAKPGTLVYHHGKHDIVFLPTPTQETPA